MSPLVKAHTIYLSLVLGLTMFLHMGEGTYCRTLPSISNGYLGTPTKITEGGTVSYTCNSGYQISPGITTATLSCLATGNWEAALTCSAVNCGTPPTISNGSLGTPTKTTFEGTVTYTCNSGYLISPEVTMATVSCLATGNWEMVTCSAVNCRTPPTISNGSVGTPTKTTFKGTVTYTCNTGYIQTKPVEISCHANGQWKTLPKCFIPPPVYFSLSSTNYIINNSEILLSSIGKDTGSYLTCHTDNTNCCRGLESGMDDVGKWHYPNGSDIPSLTTGSGGFYSSRDAPMVIRLNRRPGVAGPTGLYCCVLPTSTGTGVACVNLVGPCSGSLSFQFDYTTAIIGGVVAILLALILAVSTIIICIAYLILKQRRMERVDLKRDTPAVSVNGTGESSQLQMNETADVTYEEVDEPRPFNGNFEFSRCEAYSTAAPTSRRGFGRN